MANLVIGLLRWFDSWFSWKSVLWGLFVTVASYWLGHMEGSKQNSNAAEAGEKVKRECIKLLKRWALITEDKSIACIFWDVAITLEKELDVEKILKSG